MVPIEVARHNEYYSLIVLLSTGEKGYGKLWEGTMWLMSH